MSQSFASFYPLVGLVILLLSPSVSADYLHTTQQFQHWYGGYGKPLANILAKDCQREYKWYLTHPDECTWQGYYCSDTPIISCLLSNLPQAVQSEMAAAAVVLGLLPTVLAFVASSPVETGLVALRRPLLMLILFVSTPALPLIRSVDYRTTIKQVLDFKAERHSLIKVPTPWKAYLISASQYLLALVMLGNIAELIWELMYRVVFTAVPGTIYLPVFYIMSTTIIQILAAIAVRLRVRAVDTDESPRAPFFRVIMKDLQPCISQSGWTLTFRENSYAFQAVAWLVSVVTLVFIVLGTFMFSSALFVAQVDAIVIGSRLLLNVIVSRMILVYELHGMRHVASVRSSSEAPTSTYQSVSTKHGL